MKTYSPLVDQYPDWLTKYNIAELQQMQISDLIRFLEIYKKWTNKNEELVSRIIDPLLDRAKTIEYLWLWYITLHRPVGTLSGWEIQRLRLAKQLWNKLTWIIYVLDEPTIWLDEKEI